MFIEQNMAPNDVAAVVVTSGNRRAAQEFTSNHRLLLEAVDKFQGRKVISPGLASLATMGAPDEISANVADPQRMFNARSMLDTIASMATFAGTIPEPAQVHRDDRRGAGPRPGRQSTSRRCTPR